MRSIQQILFLLLGVLFIAATARAQDEPVILLLGDSISAAYGMQLDQAWPRLLQNRLDDNGHQYRVMNSSITGETTQGGLTRLPRLLEKHQPSMVIIELGGNDGLRGLSLEVTQENLSNMIELSQGLGACVLLTGIRLPPNYGSSYVESFEAMYAQLAAKYELLLVPFLMQDVALNPDLMQGDGIHPNAKAQPVLLENVWRQLAPALK